MGFSHEETYTNLLPGSGYENGIFRYIWHNKEGSFLLLDGEADDSVHNKLIGNIETSFLQCFSSGALVLRFLRVDFATRETP